MTSPTRRPGKAIPYGIYDLAANAGWVNVGTDHDTARVRGRVDPPLVERPGQRRLPRRAAAADHRRRRRVQRLPHPRLEGRAGRAGRARPGWRSPAATSRPAPPSGTRSSTGCSPHITMNWRGRPLTSHEVIVNTIAATTTAHRPDACTPSWTPAATPTGIKVSDAQMAALPLTRHDWHGDWNYTLRPATRPRQPAPAPARASPPPPDLAWLAHPALTGLTRPALDALTAALAAPRRPAPRSRPGPPPRLPPPPAARTRPPPPAHPHRQAHRRHPARPPRPAPPRHRRPVPAPPRRHLPPHQRHPPAPAPDRPHHPARPRKLATLDDLYRYATAQASPSHQDQTSELITASS